MKTNRRKLLKGFLGGLISLPILSKITLAVAEPEIEVVQEIDIDYSDLIQDETSDEDFDAIWDTIESRRISHMEWLANELEDGFFAIHN